jgi:hypothetical protein
MLILMKGLPNMLTLLLISFEAKLQQASWWFNSIIYLYLRAYSTAQRKLTKQERANKERNKRICTQKNKRQYMEICVI